jgi:ribosomal protein S18 acetylase RimI-like enzyme
MRRYTFFEYAMTNVKEFAEDQIGISFSVIKKICRINRLLLGVPAKLFIFKNIEDIVLTQDGEIVAGYTMKYDKIKDEYTMGNLFTRPEFQGNGYGNLMIEKMIQDYPNKRILLDVDSRNEIAIYLYKKFGFKEVATINEYTFDLPFKSKPLPTGYSVRIANKDDLTNLDDIINETPSMKNLPKAYKKSFNKTEKKILRMQNELPAVLLKEDKIVGIGRIIWPKATPNFAYIGESAVLSEAIEAYPSFISYLCDSVKEYGIKKASWEKNESTEKLYQSMKPFIGNPVRISHKMIYTR